MVGCVYFVVWGVTISLIETLPSNGNLCVFCVWDSNYFVNGKTTIKW